jgi:hypothetical protein
MADEAKMGYGYASDDVRPFNLHFGLNSNTYLVGFEFNPNAGKDNSEGEALDLKFNIAGTERNLRIYPVNKVFDKNRKEITDTASAEYVKGYNEGIKAIGAMITHVLHCYSEDIEGIKAALSRPFANFKQYIVAAKSLLPANSSKVELDIFLQYQWQPSTGKNITYLEIPRSMKHARWLCKHQEGTWKEQRVADPSESVTKALWYIKVEGEGDEEHPVMTAEGKEIEHPFARSGWFMSSAFARRTNAEGQEVKPETPEDDTDEAGAEAMNKAAGNGTVAEGTATPTAEPESSAW